MHVLCTCRKGAKQNEKEREKTRRRERESEEEREKETEREGTRERTEVFGEEEQNMQVFLEIQFALIFVSAAAGFVA